MPLFLEPKYFSKGQTARESSGAKVILSKKGRKGGLESSPPGKKDHHSHSYDRAKTILRTGSGGKGRRKNYGKKNFIGLEASTE